MIQSKDKADRVWLDGNFAIGDRQFPRQTIEQITSARMWELLEVVKKKLGHAFTPETCASGVVLTGGSAKLPGLTECASKIFAVNAHLGEAPSWLADNLRDPGYQTALGLLYYSLSGKAGKASASSETRGFLGTLSRLFSNG